MYYGGGGVLITSLLPAWPETRICLRLRQHGLNPVHLVQCLFLLYPLFLSVAYSCVVVDKKDHTTGAIQVQNLSVCSYAELLCNDFKKKIGMIFKKYDFKKDVLFSEKCLGFFRVQLFPWPCSPPL